MAAAPVVKAAAVVVVVVAVAAAVPAANTGGKQDISNDCCLHLRILLTVARITSNNTASATVCMKGTCNL